MKTEQINIRDPFVVFEDGKYYMYGSRARNFECNTNGFDVYISEDLENWSEPIECFTSEPYGLNRHATWAPEVHKYKGKYYMFATFTQENGLRGTYSLCSDALIGPFVPHSKGALTPTEWECLDGTLYVDEDGGHGMVFSDGEKTYFTYHTPNSSLHERPRFCIFRDLGDTIRIER